MNNYSRNKENRTLYKNELPSDSYYDKPISCGEGIENSPIVRVPKLKRKTAWKRFYRLFPHLKGKKVIPGSSASLYMGLNKSTIKLKKTKI